MMGYREGGGSGDQRDDILPNQKKGPGSWWEGKGKKVGGEEKRKE